MLYALIITAMLFHADGKLRTSQTVLEYETAASCAAASKRMYAMIMADAPGALLVIGCVPIERPVKS